MRHIGGTASPEAVWHVLRSVAGQWAGDGFSMFCVLEKASGKMIGRVGPQHPFGWPAGEVGWGFLSSHWGYGFAMEAALVAMDYAFNVLGWDQVAHIIAPENLESIRLAQRLGSTRLGPCCLPEPAIDRTVDLWGQTSANWHKFRIGQSA